jgi:hypothetical protein
MIVLGFTAQSNQPLMFGQQDSPLSATANSDDAYSEQGPAARLASFDKD